MLSLTAGFCRSVIQHVQGLTPTEMHTGDTTQVIPVATTAANSTMHDKWKAATAGGTYNANSTIREIAATMKLQFPVRWQVAEGHQHRLHIATHKLEELKPPKELNLIQLHAILWWISRLVFSDAISATWHADKNISKTTDYSRLEHYQCTFIELAIALEVETNVS